MIETAIVLPVFAFLLMGAVDLSRTLYLNEIAVAAARAGVHRALQGDAQNPDLRAIEAAALADGAVQGFFAKASKVCGCGMEAAQCCDALQCASNRAAYIQVDTNVPYHPLMRYPGSVSPLVIRGQATVRLQ